MPKMKCQRKMGGKGFTPIEKCTETRISSGELGKHLKAGEMSNENRRKVIT